ncbi:MAG TPA: aminoglycoside phosphotransferase family protein, partial [Caulobacteraceae bacterium]|nr:aminoglycoside phosphotransferase family protein [Caulobacteraceae bacterium]
RALTPTGPDPVLRPMSDAPEPDSIDPELTDHVAAILGWTPSSWTRVHGGYTPAERRMVRRGAESAFVKVATTPVTARMLRRELVAYRAFAAPFMPRFLGGEDHPTRPFLVIEDLGGAAWPPPWTEARVADALAAIRAMHALTPDLPSWADQGGEGILGWRKVASVPAPFLSLGLVDPDWLARSLPALVEAETACVTAGSALIHFDLRSDNICFSPRGPVFVDWAASCLGSADLDLGGWLPSLAFEGGPPPEAILPDAPEVAAWVCGYFAARAGLPPIPDAPFVRRVQREQLTTALPWVQRALKLPLLA